MGADSDVICAIITQENLVRCDKTLLIVDEDKAQSMRIARDLERKGYVIDFAQSYLEAMPKIASVPPAFAIVEIRIGEISGLDVVKVLRLQRADCRIVILTSYGTIATAVSAIKLGVVDYLTKPADADDLHRALQGCAAAFVSAPVNPMSADRVRWEHINRIYELCDRNVSETARRLNMHRRTLQRILSKRAPK